MKQGITWVIVIIVLVGGYFLLHKTQPVATAPTDTSAANDTDTSGDMKNMPMQPASAPALTVTQNAQIAAGIALHAPTALTFDVDGGNFYFAPNEIHVKKGDTVTINFKNDGGFHDFKLDEFNVATARTQSGTVSATFVADKTGTFEYYCSVGTHRQMGMKGNLIVE